MSKLVAFGCSCTQGWDLHDQYLPSEDVFDNNKPSKFAWPNIIAKKLNLPLVNLGVGGNSNSEILDSILQYPFEKNDIVLIGWTYFFRINYVKFLADNTVERVTREEFLSTDLRKYLDSDCAYKNYVIIHHAHLYLSSKNIKSYGIVIPREDITRCPKPSYIDIPNVCFDPVKFVDYAADRCHPGTKSHSLLAEKVFNIMSEDVLY
jgi:hypothetical protein